MRALVIDLGIGNSVAVRNWLVRNNVRVEIIADTQSYSDWSENLLVIPGACNSGTLAMYLKESGFASSIKNHVEKGGRVLGICAGLHCLFEEIEEESTFGLGLLEGSVKKMTVSNNGWKNTKIKVNREIAQLSKSRFKSINGRMFFNHGYRVECSSEIVAGYVEHANEMLPNLVVKNGIIGIQGHPEKSQGFGGKIAQLIGIG